MASNPSVVCCGDLECEPSNQALVEDGGRVDEQDKTAPQPRIVPVVQKVAKNTPGICNRKGNEGRLGKRDWPNPS